MKLRTLIIDDEPIALEKLKSYVSRVPFLELTAQCASGIEATNILGNNNIDLIFSDINMPDLNGLELVESLTNPPMIVFITAYSQYAVDSYKLNAIDYLLKPYSFSDFQRAANKAYDTYVLRNRNNANDKNVSDDTASVFVKVEGKYLRIQPDQIRYIKGYGEYLQLFLTTRERPVLTLSSFAAIREILPDSFIQTHRSYLVNINHISQVERSRLVMDCNTVIPISDSQKQTFHTYLHDHAIGSIKT